MMALNANLTLNKKNMTLIANIDTNYELDTNRGSAVQMTFLIIKT